MPEPGTPCNGCGVCCASEPCPLGMVVSRRRHGRCRALRWDGEQRLYRCGMLGQPHRLVHWLPPALAPWLRRWSSRWIASGIGCDARLEASRPVR